MAKAPRPTNGHRQAAPPAPAPAPTPTRSHVRIERSVVPGPNGLEPRLVIVVPCDVLVGKEHSIILKSVEAQQWAGMLSQQANQLEREYHEMLQKGEAEVTVVVPVEPDDKPTEE